MKRSPLSLMRTNSIPFREQFHVDMMSFYDLPVTGGMTIASLFYVSLAPTASATVSRRLAAATAVTLRGS